MSTSDIKKKLLTEDSMIFFLSFIILWNLGFHILIYFPLEQSPDAQDYLSMAQLESDQSPVRRYRIIIPWIAYLINSVFGWCFDLFHPWSFEGDFSLCLSFLMVNTIIMSFVMMMIFKLCKSFQIGFWYCLLAVIAILSSRWSAEISGLPLVDSLYLLSLVIALYGLKTKQWIYLIASIWIGPWAKEAFIFMVPLILLFAKEVRVKMILHLFLSGILVFGFRFLYEWHYGLEWMSSINEDISTFSSIGISLKRLFSLHGLYDIFSVIGFWIILPCIVYLKYKNAFIAFYRSSALLFSFYLLIVLFQALLSTDISRMLYLSIPVIAVWVGISLKMLLEDFEKYKYAP
jgi:hypothetical protein